MIRFISLLAGLSLATMGASVLGGCSSGTETGNGPLTGSGGSGGGGGTGGAGGSGISGSAGAPPQSVGGGGAGGSGVGGSVGSGGASAGAGGIPTAGSGGTPAGGAGGSGGGFVSNCPVEGASNPDSLLGKATMEGSGESGEQYHTAEVSRDGDPYVLITNGWGPGFDKHEVSWNGTSFIVESMTGEAGSMGQPASYPTVFCGRYSVRQVPACGLPIRRDEITTLKTGWRWHPNCNEGEYNAAYDIWVGNGTQLQGYLMVWLRDPPSFQPAGQVSAHQSVTVANVPGIWNIWTGTVNNLPIINWVRQTGSESYEIEFDVMDFIRDAEMRGLNVPGTHINAVAVGFEIWEGPIADLRSEDFYVQVN